MDRNWQSKHYTVRHDVDAIQGCTRHTLLVANEPGGERDVAALATFWDATGQFVIEVQPGEWPLDILDEFSAEARAWKPG